MFLWAALLCAAASTLSAREGGGGGGGVGGRAIHLFATTTQIAFAFRFGAHILIFFALFLGSPSLLANGRHMTIYVRHFMVPSVL